MQADETTARAGRTAGPAFLFDFDGTITTCEMLPRIAAELGLERELEAVTSATTAGRMPFDESLRARVEILRRVPVARVAQIVDTAPVFPELLDWILARRDRCWIVTGNLDCWVGRWMGRHGLRYFASTATRSADGEVSGVETVLDKASVLPHFAGRQTVVVGDGANDAALMAAADIGIAVATVNDPPPVVRAAADHVIDDVRVLCRTLSLIAAPGAVTPSRPRSAAGSSSATPRPSSPALGRRG